MNRPLSNAVDIKPQPKRPWTVLIQVVENGHVQQSRPVESDSKSGGSDFKRLILTDSQGTKLTALIFSNYLRYFAKLLLPYKRYYISNADVIRNDTKYRISSYPYSWVLNNKTLVEELVEPIPANLPCAFEFTNFHDLHKHADTENLQNVKVVVLTCFQSKEQGTEVSSKRDIVIVNEEKKLMLLTLWNEFDDNEGCALAKMINTGPIIFGMRLKVTTFNGLSFPTRSASGLMINPPTTTTTTTTTTGSLQMREWYDNNKQELLQLLHMETYKNHNLLLPYPQDEDIISIAKAVSSLKTMKTAWIKGKMTLVNRQKSYWYTVCANCQKSLNGDLSWIITCPSCRVESELQAMSRLTVVIDDKTASIQATMCTPEVETFIPFTGLELKEAEENSIDLSNDIAASIQQHTIVAFIRSYEATFRGQTEMKVTVVAAYKNGEPLPSTNLHTSAKHVPNSTEPLPLTNPNISAKCASTSTPNLPTDKEKRRSIPSTPAKRESSPIASRTKDVTAQEVCKKPSKKSKDSDT